MWLMSLPFGPEYRVQYRLPSIERESFEKHRHEKLYNHRKKKEKYRNHKNVTFRKPYIVQVNGGIFVKNTQMTGFEKVRFSTIPTEVFENTSIVSDEFCSDFDGWTRVGKLRL